MIGANGAPIGRWRQSAISVAPPDAPGRSYGEAKAVITMHKFTIGQIVQFRPDRFSDAPRGPYELTKRLPHNGTEYEYRIKSAHEEHERIAKEKQLSSA